MSFLLPLKRVYLAGPISGLTSEEARYGWRAQFAAMMPQHILCLSPMRGKDFLDGKGKLPGDPDAFAGFGNPLATAQGITTRDRNDVETCDMMVAHVLGTEKASVGTCIEFGWADAYRKPVVLIIEPNGKQFVTYGLQTTEFKINPHWHGMVQQVTGYHTSSVEDAARIVKAVLTPGI